MSVSAEELFDRGLDFFDGVVSRLDEGAWDGPSAAEGWTNLDVLGHVGGNMAIGTRLLRGEEVEWSPVERPGEQVDGPPSQYWRAIAADARDALAGADLDHVMDTPMGPRSVRDRLAFPAIDLFVHAWDIGHATGMAVEIPDDVIEFTHSYIDPLPSEMVRSPGVFGPPVELPAGASSAEAFLAWTGRDPR